MKGRRVDLSQTPCAASRALQIIGDWWSLLIVRDALMGVQRFSEFQKSIGLAKNILSARLKKLVEDGIFVVETDADSPSRPRYRLTEKGERLGVVLAALWQWGEENCFAAGETCGVLADQASGKPVAKIGLQTIDGRPLELKGLRMAPAGPR